MFLPERGRLIRRIPVTEQYCLPIPTLFDPFNPAMLAEFLCFLAERGGLIRRIPVTDQDCLPVPTLFDPFNPAMLVEFLCILPGRGELIRRIPVTDQGCLPIPTLFDPFNPAMLVEFLCFLAEKEGLIRRIPITDQDCLAIPTLFNLFIRLNSLKFFTPFQKVHLIRKCILSTYADTGLISICYCGCWQRMCFSWVLIRQTPQQIIMLVNLYAFPPIYPVVPIEVFHALFDKSAINPVKH